MRGIFLGYQEVSDSKLVLCCSGQALFKTNCRSSAYDTLIKIYFSREIFAETAAVKFSTEDPTSALRNFKQIQKSLTKPNTYMKLLCWLVLLFKGGFAVLAHYAGIAHPALSLHKINYSEQGPQRDLKGLPQDAYSHSKSAQEDSKQPSKSTFLDSIIQGGL